MCRAWNWVTVAGGAACGIAHLDQLEQLEAARPACRPDHLADLHRADRAGEGGRDLVEAAPAQFTALERVRAVRITHRRGSEIHLALVEQVLDAVDLLLRGRDLLGGRAFGQRDQDVGQPVLRCRPRLCAASAASTSASLTLMRLCAKLWRKRWMTISSRSEARKSL